MAGGSFMWYLDLLFTINPFYLLLGIPMLFVSIISKRVASWPVVAFTVVFSGLIARPPVHFDRNVLPVMVVLIVMVGLAVDAILDLLPARVRDWRLGSGSLRASPVVLGAFLIPLVPSLLVLPGFAMPPIPSGKALAQEWFDQALQTPGGRQYLNKGESQSLNIIAEGYTVYLNPRECSVKYVPAIAKRPGGVEEVREEGYDVAILGSGMFNRFYEDRASFPKETRIYDEFFEKIPDVLAFENRPFATEFIPGGSNVYVLLLTDEAKEFAEEVSGGLEGGPEGSDQEPQSG